MSEVMLARWQFGITTVYHFFFVPLTLGLSLLIALMETAYVRTGDAMYKRMARFWGRLFLINFAMGVVTGLVQEFQFGMNWSEYSRFVGDVFGVPLAIEALVAFFLESIFIGIWVFGWKTVSPRLHLAAIWLAAIGANLSALWILVAHSWMQWPVGYAVRDGRAEMTDFAALLLNRHLFFEFSHVFFAGIATAGFFVLGISAWHLLRRSPDLKLFRSSFRFAAIYGLVGSLLVAVFGHGQAQDMVQTHPMKMAASEDLWASENPAALRLFVWPDAKTGKPKFEISIPYALSFLAFNKPTGMVRGINELQAEYTRTYGPDNYVPPLLLMFWSFRAMVGAGLLMIVLGGACCWFGLRRAFEVHPWLLRTLVAAIALPYLANTCGWLMTEIGRQPWIVYGVLKTSDAVSKAVSRGELWFSLVAFTLVYGALMVADVILLRRFSIAGTTGLNEA